MRKPQKRTFGDLLDEFVEVTLPGRGVKKSTLADYKSIIRNHLRPEFGDHDLATLSHGPRSASTATSRGSSRTNLCEDDP